MQLIPFKYISCSTKFAFLFSLVQNVFRKDMCVYIYKIHTPFFHICIYVPIDNCLCLAAKGTPACYSGAKHFYFNNSFSQGSEEKPFMAISKTYLNSMFLGITFWRHCPPPCLCQMNYSVGICLMEHEHNISQSNQDTTRTSWFGIKL